MPPSIVMPTVVEVLPSKIGSTSVGPEVSR